MSRPKGSKNKKKEKPVVTPPPVVEKATKPQGHGVGVIEEFNPKPDMGKIKPPPEGDSACECLHNKSMHYGPERDWCNTGGCQCQTFKRKES